MNISIFLFLSFLAVSLVGQDIKPVNKNASPEAKELLNFLYKINGKHIISGQHNYNSDMDKYSQRAQEITGNYPALWGSDFIWNYDKDPGEKIVAEAIKRHREGQIITLMWHAGRPVDNPPFDWKGSIQAELTDEEWKELITPDSPLNKRWIKQIDVVAGYLKQLNDAGVPVLWRPFHEMNGVWFWWGDKKGEDGFIKLWKMMYDRYVDHHGLNNLIWVWNANAPRDIPMDEAFSYHLFYPGADYVDVLAADVYHFDYEQKDYNELLELANGKLIALGEVGQLPKAEILKFQPKWAWFMVWSNWLETHNTEERVKEVYNYPPTITLDELLLLREGQ